MAPPSIKEQEETLTSTDHNAITLALAKKESAEHMQGMKELFETMRSRPLRVYAYPMDHEVSEENFHQDNSGAENNTIIDIKTVHFVRHGQGFHNLLADMAREQGREWEQFTKDKNNPYIAPEILDAPLTDKGRQQAIRLQPIVRSLPHPPELVVLSPNCRALQTGVLVFEHLLDNDDSHNKDHGGGGGNDVPFLAHEMAREENGIHICDKRRPKSQQAREFPQVDFSLLESEHDPLYRTDQRESKAEVGERIYRFFQWLVDRPEEHVAVASHSGWLLTVFCGVCDCQDHEQLRAWFQTGELRSVKLVFVRQRERQAESN